MYLLQLVLGVALAQDVTGGAVPEINAQNFRPTIDGQQTLWLDDSLRGPDRTFRVRGLFHYTDDPLVYLTADGEEVGIVTNVLQADVLGSYSIGRVRLGLDLPVYLYQAGAATNGAGLGDVALDGKVTILDDDGESAPLGLAGNIRLNLPTASVDGALGAANTGWEIAAIADKRIENILLALNLGLKGGPDVALENIRVNDFLDVRFGGAYAISENGGASLEFASKLPFAAPLAEPGALPFEGLVGGYGYLNENVVLRGGLGSGLSSGVGTPDFRVVLGVGYEPRENEPEPVDTDGDGLTDDVDPCPTAAEDLDQFEDEDGCPEADNDKDGIEDSLDDCPLEPEDMDGVKDGDGCPEPESKVAVRLLDMDSGDPLEVGRTKVSGGDVSKSGQTTQNLELVPGTYTLEGSAAGYEAGSVEFTVSDDGASVDLRLLKKAETKVVVTRDRINLQEKVYFDTGRATIKKASHDLLDQAVQILRDYPEIKKMRIEGHTDSRGSESTNQKLSQARAESVRQYFIDAGIEAERLTAEGFGESRPIDPAENAEAWEKNRRVDFFIEVWEDIPAEE